VRESDFRPLEGSVRRRAKEPFGFFEFVPSEQLDLDLVDRTIVAALDEVDSVRAVILPESAVDQSELDDLETLLSRHGVPGLIAGVRQRAEQPGGPSANWVHIAVSTGDRWVRIRQNKHHRWSLDERQIHQYHLGGALHPHIRWWEASEVPRRAVQFIDVGDGIVVVSLVCEDLAQIDNVADLLRSVGPTIVITPLLDGPQLSSRWAARYASVLADDPGSAVLTLTSAGMAQRSRPLGHDASSVIALWKDPIRGIREIPLEPGAHGVLLTASTDLASRRSSDGRSPIDNCIEFFDVGVYQVRAADAGTSAGDSIRQTAFGPVLEADELTVLTSWAEAVAEALAYAPEQAEAVLADAQPRAPWRAALGLPEPSPQLTKAFVSVQQSVRAATPAAGRPTLDAVLESVRHNRPSEHEFERLAHRVLRSALEQRQMRRTREGGKLADAASASERQAPKAA
jgi:hypothetical protein